jgi:class 3 adenylate cyclase/DNA-binding NarL/FixJ family response regulator
MSAELPTGTLTFLFTDVEGSTRLVNQLGSAYADVLLDQQRLLRAAFAEAGGSEIDTQGDAFFVVFQRAKEAVAGALAAQRSLRDHSWPQGVEVRVRMAMHTGEPGIAGDRYFGLGVHRAARICAAGHGGQLLLSQSTYSVLADDVLPDIRFDYLGQYRLKDIERPEHIYQLSVLDLPHSFPPLRAEGETAFNGRERELAAAATAALDAKRIRVVVADDSVLLRDGLCRLLEDSGFDVVGRAGDADGLLRQVAVNRPDVAITDIRMPPTHTDEGLVAARELRDSFAEVGVLVLSQHLDARYALRLLEGYPERVGYLLKERVSDVAILTDAVRRIAEGECVIDPTIVSQLMRRRDSAGAFAEATDEERKVASLVAEGYSDESIAKQLRSDVETVHERIEGAFARLGIPDSPDDLRRVGLLLRALRS